MSSTDAFCSTCGAPSGGRAQGTPEPARPRNPSPLPGQLLLNILSEITLGRFEILKLLGQGGMGSVALARDIQLDTLRAIKVLGMHLAEDPDMRERFFAEARTQARLDHPHIVPVYLVDQNAELPYFVMQYVPGRSLQDVLKREATAGRSLPVDVVLALMQQIGSALAHAHRKGVVHRDIKPANVILNASGNAVVTDFGIAKVLSAAPISITGSIIGTPPYMSPEQCRATRELTGASDQYSLGIVAYELLCGRTPFRGSMMEVVEAHKHEPPVQISQLRRDIPPSLAGALMRMLAKEPEARFPDLQAALSALGAHEVSSSPNDSVRAALIRLAAVEEQQATLVDVLRSPESPPPQTRERIERERREREERARQHAPPELTVTNLVLQNSPTTTQIGASMLFVAVPRDASGNIVEDAKVSWSASDVGVLRIDETTGRAEAIGSGTCYITARCGSMQAKTIVTVSALGNRIGPLMAASPPRIRIEPTASTSFESKAVDASGEQAGGGSIPLKGGTSGQRNMIFAIVGVAALILAGVAVKSLVVSRADGVVSDTTRNGLKEGPQNGDSATLGGPTRVQPDSPVGPKADSPIVRGSVQRVSLGRPSRTTVEVGDSLRLTATISGGEPSPAVGVRWSSSDSTIARVDERGMVTAIAPGSVEISARSGSARDATRLSMVATRVERLEIAGPATLKVNESGRVSVVAFSAVGSKLPAPSSVSYVSTSPAIATVDAEGVVVAHRAGETRIEARAGGLSAHLELNVLTSPSPPETVPLSPKDSSASLKNPIETYNANESIGAPSIERMTRAAELCVTAYSQGEFHSTSEGDVVLGGTRSQRDHARRLVSYVRDQKRSIEQIPSAQAPAPAENGRWKFSFSIRVKWTDFAGREKNETVPTEVLLRPNSNTPATFMECRITGSPKLQ